MLANQNSANLPLDGEFLEPSGFFEKFVQLAASAQNSFFKLERLQSYDESGAPYHDAFISGDWDRSVALFKEQIETGSASAIDFCRRGISSTRLRLVEFPLTDYVKWEMMTYHISASYGQRILVRDITAEPEKGSVKASSDFVMFDDQIVLRHVYQPDGQLRGALLFEGARAARYNEFVKTLLPEALPLGAFESRYSAELKR